MFIKIYNTCHYEHGPIKMKHFPKWNQIKAQKKQNPKAGKGYGR